ncbi:MAG: C39 family peptidase [bacterium]|nr:C39 family peptidase [bacterium]
MKQDRISNQSKQSKRQSNAGGLLGLSRRDLIKFVGSTSVLAGLVFAVPVLTQDTFDPSSVQPRGCQNGSYDCGMKPPSRERFASIPLAPSGQIRHRGLPSRVDLSSKMPPIGNQGTQGSCVAWATGYALKSYHEKVERRWNYDSPVAGGSGNRVFSPAFIYNQINGGRDDGSVISDALALIVRQGAAPWSAMPYNVNDYRRKPTAAAKRAAANYKAQSYRRLNSSDLDSIKAELSKGNPVVFGIGVDDAFYNLRDKVYDKNQGQFYGGHAMTLVGYDDSKKSPRGHRGAFKLINSWGTGWGDRGYGWISYKQWVAGDAWALVLYDRVDSNNNEQPEEPEELEEPDEADLSPPTTVTATKGTHTNKVVVNWAAVTGAAVYVVARAEPSDPKSFRSIGYAQATNYADTAVQPDVAYRYIVVAVADKENYSDPQQSPIGEGYAASRKQTTPPEKVTGISAKVKAVAGRGSVSISWSSVPGATSYEVARYNARVKKWVLVKRGARGESHTDRRPVANQTNYYSVRAVNRSGKGQWGDPASIDIGGKATIPAVPSGVTASEGTFKTKVEVKWPSVPGATIYYLFRYDYDSEEWEGPQQTTRTTYVDDDESVSEGDHFAYVVVASNSAGNSDYSQPAIGRANPNATRAGMVLPPPSGVKAKVDERAGTISISWDRVKGAAEYYVFRKKEKQDEYQFVKEVNARTLRYSEKVPGQPGELYFYVIRSKSALGGESDNSAPVAGFINKSRDIVRHRFLPGQGIDRFTGTWKARHWNGKGAPKEYTLVITANGGDFTGQLQLGNARAKSFSGSYAANSDVMQAKGIRLETTDVDGTLTAQIRKGPLSRADMDLTFVRE